MTAFDYATVLSEREADGVRTITLNRPESLNAMNRQLIDDVAQAFADADADPDLVDEPRAVRITGMGARGRELEAALYAALDADPSN